MHRLSDLALEAILREFDSQDYDPLHTDVWEWIDSIELLCDTYGVPDVQRPQCATAFTKGDFRTDLENALAEARERFGPVHWVPFKNSMVAFDQYREYDLIAINIEGFDPTNLNPTENSRDQWESEPPFPFMPWFVLTRSPTHRTSILQEAP